MRMRTWLTLAGTLFFGASAATAGELVYFSNGTFLKIESHEIKGEMVSVQLDPSSKLAFPAKLIDRIEGNAGVVWGNGATATIAKNQALPGAAPQGDGMQGLRGVNPGSKKNWNPDPGSGIQATQKSVQTGFGMAGNAGEKQYLDGVILGATRTNPDGSKMIGNRLVVNPDVITSQKRQPVAFQAVKQNFITPPPAPVPQAPPQIGDVVTAPSHQPVEDPPPAMPDDPPAEEQPQDPGDAGDQGGDGGDGGGGN